MNIFKILKNYGLSLSVVIGIGLYYLFNFENILDRFIDFMLSLDYRFVVLSGIGCYLGSIGLVFPYLSFFKGKRNIKSVFGQIFDKSYIDCLADKNLEREFEEYNNEGEIGFLFFSMSLLSIIGYISGGFGIFGVCFAITFGIFIFNIIDSENIFIKIKTMFLPNIIRYILELPRSLFLFMSLGMGIGLEYILLFMIFGSILYKVKYFKNTIGLMSLFLMCFFWFLGYNPLIGFFVSILHVAISFVFFLIPVSIIRKVKNK